MAGELLLPPRLRPDDRVRLVSPASYPDRALVDQCLKVLESWDLRGEVARHAFDERGYMAGSDNDRLEDLNEAFRDPGVRAVVATRGGAGAYRIADRLDFAAVRADPKPLVGYSDITYLHLSLLRHCQLTGIHGCLVGSTAQASVRRLLMSADPIVLQRVSEAVSAEVEIPGRARGRLIGGNLASLATSVGVRFPSMFGAVLFLEDQRVVGLGTIDRQLTQLISSGVRDTRAEIWLHRLLVAVAGALPGSAWETQLLDVAGELQTLLRSGIAGDELGDAALAATADLRHSIASAC